MDFSLLAWARAVKVRRPQPFPPLWLFTDEARLGDPCCAVRRLPRGLAGVVFRHDGAADRAALGQALARICRARRLAFVVAGDARLAARLKGGLHLRRGRWQKGWAARGLLTASAHNRAELVRAGRMGVGLVFLGPAFATASHPGQRALGAVRWNALARCARSPVAAIGGITGRSIRCLPRAGACGAIAALG
ncbi:MAG: thiamine phosphate synthase [Acetobacteraceae bacterium]